MQRRPGTARYRRAVDPYQPGPDQPDPDQPDPDQPDPDQPDRDQPDPDRVDPDPTDLTGSAADPARPSARDLVRRRRGVYRAPETGRHHHIGAAPDRQPLLGDDGSAADGPRYVEAAAVQLAQRTVAQLQRQRERTRAQMAEAARDLDFEGAAGLRDALAAIGAELVRRGHPPD